MSEDRIGEAVERGAKAAEAVKAFIEVYRMGHD